MKNQIQELINAEGLTPSKLAEILGVQPSSISHILSGRNNPGYEFISKILVKFPSLNPRWLLLGKGDMYEIKGRVSVADSLIKEDLNEDNYDSLTPTSGLNQAPALKQETKKMKEVDKIIIFYSDKTFETYQN